MASVESDVPATGCLILLLQMSALMKIDVPSHRGPFPKSHLVRLLADEVVEDLVIGNGEGVVPDNFEVSIVGYRTVNEGPAAVSLLPDDKAYPHFLSVSQLATMDVPRRKRGDMLRKWSGPCEEEGEASPVAALANVHWIIQRWQADHPRSLPPIIVHCCDGTGLSAEYDLIARSMALLGGVDPAVCNGSTCKAPCLFHCVITEAFSGRMLPFQYCGGLCQPLEQLWSASSILESEPANCRGHVPRGLSINDWPRTELRQVWERLILPPPPMAIEPEILELPSDGDSQSATELPSEAVPIIESEATKVEEPSGVPLFTHRNFWLVKRGNDANQWEDAFAADPSNGTAAIADGAGAGIFCRQWAALLCERWMRDLPDMTDPNAYRTWLDGCRSAWMEAINYKTIRIFQRMKVDDVGAATTLLGLRIERDAVSNDYHWRAVAVGDSVLFWVRDNALIAAFPLTRGSQFDIAPLLLRSKRMPPPGFSRASGVCQTGDVFVLATDAVAHALFDEHDRGPVDWARFETLDPTIWEKEMERLRDDNRMVNDDCTLLILRVGSTRAPALRAEPGETAASPIPATALDVSEQNALPEVLNSETANE